ncbi:MAG: hypothetical protein H0T42_14700 [Deltaproteobacteria bacterium]|nr:hypothetical protein [Deltaproteobacteria bacterium]
MRTAILLLLVACGGAAAPVGPPPPTGPTCAGAAEHMVDEMAAAKEPRPPDDVLNGLIDLIRVRCEQDRWSSEAVLCLSRIKTAAEADQCGTMLTDAQQAALVRDQEAKAAPSK